jgi:hypothetical protein
MDTCAAFVLSVELAGLKTVLVLEQPVTVARTTWPLTQCLPYCNTHTSNSRQVHVTQQGMLAQYKDDACNKYAPAHREWFAANSVQTV